MLDRFKLFGLNLTVDIIDPDSPVNKTKNVYDPRVFLFKDNCRLPILHCAPL